MADITKKWDAEIQQYAEAYDRVVKFLFDNGNINKKKSTEELIAQIPPKCPASEREEIKLQLDANGADSFFWKSVDRYENAPRNSNCYPKELKPYDYSLFQVEAKFRRLDVKRGEILQEYNVQNLPSHPFINFYREKMPMKYIDSARSLPAFAQFPDAIHKKYPKVFEDRKLTVVYPGSGSRLGSLYIAFLSIDKKFIDSASFIFTEIKPVYMRRIHDQLQRLQQAGVIHDYTAKAKIFTKSEGGGSEIYFKFTYQNKPILLTLALSRSGKEYWRKEYVKEADLFIFDDTFSENAGNQNLYKEKGELAPDRFLLESNIGNEFPGPYGHCGSLFSDRNISKLGKPELDGGSHTEITNCQKEGGAELGEVYYMK